MSQFLHLNFVTFISYLCWTAGKVSSQQRQIYPSSGSDEGNIGSSYFYYQQPVYPRDCIEVKNQCSTYNVSGVHLIKPDGYPEPFEVYCDNAVDSGEWTVIHRLQDGSVLFNRSWTEYKTGFGFLSQEFWMGNDKLSFLTNQNTYELRIDVTSTNGLSFYITYNRFRISDEFSEYKMTSVGEYNGMRDKIDHFLCPANIAGWTYISRNCSRRCFCNSGHLSCDDYQCSPDAVCEDRSNGSQCYCNTGYKGDGVNCTIDGPPTDCQDVYERVSTESGVYKIKPTTWQGESFDVYCNMTDEGGWTVFQRRVDGSQDFALYWSDYKDGFGTPNHELWLGNDKLHSLTTQKNYELRVDLVNSLGNPYYAKYTSFRINDENDKYTLSLGSYSEGDAGDQLYYDNGQAFSTRDRDNDGNSYYHCAYHTTSWWCSKCNYNGGWWYSNCNYAPLNNPYGSDCFGWHNLPGSRCNIKFAEMKLRPT